MGMKETNEITVRIAGDMELLYKTLKDKGFEISDKYSLEDEYFVPEALSLDTMGTRDILSQAVLIRKIQDTFSGELIQRLTFKRKVFDEKGSIVQQSAVNCGILKVDDARKLLVAMGYRFILRIQEKDTVYQKDGLELAVKNVCGGDQLIEIESIENHPELDTVDKLENKLRELALPVDATDFFVKKAEIELDKALGRCYN